MADKYYATFDLDGVIATRLIEGINAIPQCAVAIDSALWLKINREQDGVWTLCKDGTIVKQPLPVIEPDFPGQERHWRNSELISVTWLRDRHRDQLELGIGPALSAEWFAELLTYTQALRDWPQSPGFPDRQFRPVAPDWIAAQIP